MGVLLVPSLVRRQCGSLHRVFGDGAVVGQVANERMRGEELELDLLGRLTLHELAHRPQSIGGVALGRFAGRVDGAAAVFAGQGRQSL